ncbi:hypothetical protein [Haloglycomyces albus]|uniref:hypothetical protein n=1 Tax=Haloglycomyces albus TaxID=526067 RepID=UPI0004BBC52E|nr:hypothetical protein [Haloglycomyces albus]
MYESPVSQAPSVSPGRHPNDPEPVLNTKILAAQSLSMIAVVLSPLVGGFFAATVALQLVRQGEKDVRDSDGFMLGGGRVARIRRRAKLALGVSTIAAVFAVCVVVLWLLQSLLSEGASFGGDTV